MPVSFNQQPTYYRPNQGIVGRTVAQAPPMPTNPQNYQIGGLLSPNQLFTNPGAPPGPVYPGQTNPGYQQDNLSLNFQKRARMSPIQVLQMEASASSINRVIDQVTGTKNTYNNRVQMLVDGKESFGKMKEYINSAQNSIYMEMFIWHEDQTGWDMAELLVKKKKEGVDVKVIIDALGYQPEKGRLVEYLNQNGVETLLYNKDMIDWDKMNITHRKLLLVDGYKGVTGGMNIGKEYEHTWHDLMMSVEGEAVQEMQNEFFYDWRKAGGVVPANPPQLPRGVHFGNSASRITVTSPDEPGKEKDTKNAMISAMNSALHHIYIEQPYFSDDDFVNAAVAAAKRGVKVKVFLPGNSDNPVHNDLNKRNAQKVVEAGGEAFFIDPGNTDKDYYQQRFTHGKIMTIDGVWTTIGSTNTDYRALAVNQELNISVTDAEFTADVERRVFAADERSSVPFHETRFPFFSRLKARVFGFFQALF